MGALRGRIEPVSRVRACFLYIVSINSSTVSWSNGRRVEGQMVEWPKVVWSSKSVILFGLISLFLSLWWWIRCKFCGYNSDTVQVVLERWGRSRTVHRGFTRMQLALPRRRRPRVARIGTQSALHPRSAIPRQFDWSLASSWYLRLTSTGLATALDLENVKLLGYDFAVLQN